MKRRLFEQFYSGDARQRLSALNRVILAAIISSVAVAVLGTEQTLVERAPTLFLVLDAAFGVFFILEYVLRLWVVGEIPRFKGFLGRLRYAASPVALIDLIVIIPFILQWSGAEELYVLRLLRLLRIVALAKLGRFSQALYRVGQALYSKRFELYASVSMAGLLLLVAASMMYLIEGAHQPETFGSIPRALWWSIATLTTVGYGDVYPATPLGKVFGGITAVSAIGLIALPAGILAGAFSEALKGQE